MKRRNPFQLPTMNVLITFESAARLASLTSGHLGLKLLAVHQFDNALLR